MRPRAGLLGKIRPLLGCGTTRNPDGKRPPHHDGWQCSITFDGKDKAADLNADICLFLEEWENNRESFKEYGMSKSAYEAWKDKTLAYYASQGVEMSELEELDEDERIKGRAALLSGE